MQRHERIQIGRELLGDGICEVTAMIASYLLGIFVHADKPITRSQILQRFGSRERIVETRFSRVLGMMHKRGLISFDWDTRQWSSLMEIKEDGIFRLNPLAAIEDALYQPDAFEYIPARQELARIEHAIGRSLTSAEVEKYNAYVPEDN